MQNTIQEKFIGYQRIIKSNLNTIKELIEQSKKLAEIVDLVKDDSSKKTIQEIKQSIEKSIDKLLDNTNKLFSEYKNLIEKYASAA